MSIEMAEAMRKRLAWGDKPCDHAELEVEVSSQGQKTGDYACKQCGEARWGDDWNRKQS